MSTPKYHSEEQSILPELENKTFYKITNDEEYKDGLNISTHDFTETNKWFDFTDINHIFNFFNNGCYLTIVNLPLTDTEF